MSPLAMFKTCGAQRKLLLNCVVHRNITFHTVRVGRSEEEWGGEGVRRSEEENE
jgi:hypothetical protein